MKIFNTSYSDFLKRALNMHTSQNQAISENINHVNNNANNIFEKCKDS